MKCSYSLESLHYILSLHYKCLTTTLLQYIYIYIYIYIKDNKEIIGFNYYCARYSQIN